MPIRLNPNLAPDLLTAIQQSQQNVTTATQQLGSGRRVNHPNPFRDHLLTNSVTRNRRNSIFLHFAS